MNDETLKSMIERLASECDAYIDLVTVRKDLMTQKTYSTKRDHHINEIGDSIALLIESRLKSKKAGVTPEEASELQTEHRELGQGIIEFIDSRIGQIVKAS